MDPISVTMEIKTGFSIRSGHGLAGVLDGVILRDHNRLPYIPGATLKALIKDACCELAGVARLSVYPDVKSECEAIIERGKSITYICDSDWSEISRIFGTPFLPPLFEFRSAYLTLSPEDTEAISASACWAESHNSICEATGTAREDFLFTFEVAAPAGKSSIFSSYRYSFQIVPKKDVIEDRLTSLLMCGIRFVDRVGANKSRGKGVMTMEIPENYGGKSLREWIDITFPFEKEGA